MQIVEANELAVRVAELHLVRAATPLRFVLYPMLHFGSPEFYLEVNRRLRSADVIVTEGVGESRTVQRLTRGYRAVANDAQLGLVLQNLDYASTGAEVICPDLTGPEFERAWRTVPLWQRGLVRAISDSLPLAQRVLGEAWLRETLEQSSLDDLPSPEEVLSPDLPPDVDRVIMDERDDRLLEALAGLHVHRSAEPITVAVVYGAQHMRAVSAGLMRRYGYHVRAGAWLTVIAFT